MMLKIPSLLLVGLAFVVLVIGNQLPVRSQFVSLPSRRFIPIRIPIRRPPIHRIPIVTVTPPSMVDSNFTFVKPSVFAKDCMNAMGSLVSKCQTQSQADWDPVKLNTSKETTWESCCSVFDELNCYVQNAYTFCPIATRKAVVDYSRKVGLYFESTICRSVSFNQWKSSCNNDTHNAQVHNNTVNPNNQGNSSFINLPPEDGPEKACFGKLRTATKVNIEKQCQDTANKKWDPDHRKLMESAILESCCAIFETMDCLEKGSDKVCTSAEQKDLFAYTKKSKAAFNDQLCTNVNMKLCQKSSGSSGVLPSILVTLFASFLCFLIY